MMIQLIARRFITIFVPSVIFPLSVQAETLLNNQEVTSRVIFGLAGIVIVIMLLGWLINYIKKHSQYSGGGRLKLVSQLPLGVKEKIAIVDIGNQQIVIGVTANSINKLHVLDDHDRFVSEAEREAERIIKENQRYKNKESTAFKTYLKVDWFINQVTKKIKHYSMKNNKKPLSAGADKPHDKESFKDVLNNCDNVVQIDDKR